MNCVTLESENLIRLYYQSFNDGDQDGMLALLSEGVIHEVNQGGVQVGRSLFAEFLKHMEACYEENVEDLAVCISSCGTRAAAEFFIRGRYVRTDPGLPEAAGQNYHLRVGAFFEIVSGKIARVTNYYNLADWLRMVG
jgi:steroid delta-isomerase-like uncharacterized protein